MAQHSICSCVKMCDGAKVLSNIHKIDIMDNKSTRLCGILENMGEGILFFIANVKGSEAGITLQQYTGASQ